MTATGRLVAGILYNVLERCVYNHGYCHFDPQIYNLKHGLMRDKYMITRLLEVLHDSPEPIANSE